MSTKNQNTKEAQATGRIVITGKVKATRVSQAQTIVGQIKATPAYATTPTVQAATDAYVAATNALTTNLNAVKAARTALVPLLASQVTLDADMRRTQKDPRSGHHRRRERGGRGHPAMGPLGGWAHPEARLQRSSSGVEGPVQSVPSADPAVERTFAAISATRPNRATGRPMRAVAAKAHDALETDLAQARERRCCSPVSSRGVA